MTIELNLGATLVSPMEAYRGMVTMLQSRIQRLEENLENLENSRVEVAQESALLKELLQLCLEKDDQLRRYIAELNEIRKEFEELKHVYAERWRHRICAVM